MVPIIDICYYGLKYNAHSIVIRTMTDSDKSSMELKRLGDCRSIRHNQDVKIIEIENAILEDEYITLVI